MGSRSRSSEPSGSTLTKAGSGISITTAQIGDAAGDLCRRACVGALFFGHLTDRLGRRRLFLVTLGLYLVATVLTSTSRNAWMFFAFRFLTGMGIGGEYAAINSAIDELIPARVRGTVDLLINGSFWLGTAAGAAATLVLLDPKLLALDLGWRTCFFLGAVLGLGRPPRTTQPPREPALALHPRSGRRGRAIVDDIERQVRDSTGQELDEPGDPIEVRQRPPVGFLECGAGCLRRLSAAARSSACRSSSARRSSTTRCSSPIRSYSRPSTTSLPDSVGYYLIAFAIGNFLGPLVLGRLFDVVGRRAMIAGRYLAVGIDARRHRMAVRSWRARRADTQTIAWMVIFFFASAGASAAYLTVSEIFPMETRALAIAFFYAVGTGLGGIIGPVLFGNLIATKRPADMAVGYLIGGGLMMAAGLVEVFLGVNAEQKSLEDIATPLSAVEGGADHRSSDAPPDSLPRQTGPYPVPRRRLASTAWAPLPQASSYPRTNPYQAREVDVIVEALQRKGSQTLLELRRAATARYWGPGRFRAALRSGLASGRIRRVGRGRFAAGTTLDGHNEPTRTNGVRPSPVAGADAP